MLPGSRSPGSPGNGSSAASIVCGAASRSSQRRTAAISFALDGVSAGANARRTRLASGWNVASTQPGASPAAPARTVRRTVRPPTSSMPGIARWARKRSSRAVSYGSR